GPRRLCSPRFSRSRRSLYTRTPRRRRTGPPRLVPPPPLIPPPPPPAPAKLAYRAPARRPLTPSPSLLPPATNRINPRLAQRVPFALTASSRLPSTTRPVSAKGIFTT